MGQNAGFNLSHKKWVGSTDWPKGMSRSWHQANTSQRSLESAGLSLPFSHILLITSLMIPHQGSAEAQHTEANETALDPLEFPLQ